MDIIHVLLRLLHILSAFAWIGIGAVTTLYIAPAALKSGESGLRFLKVLFTRTNIGGIVGAVAGLTTLAGILLYLVSNSASYFSQLGNIVLGIGAAAGILATIHGGAVTSRATRALTDGLNEHVPDGEQSITASGLSVLRERAESLLSHSRVSLVLMIIALIGMGSARYL
jgi:hypothetical protein